MFYISKHASKTALEKCVQVTLVTCALSVATTAMAAKPLFSNSSVEGRNSRYHFQFDEASSDYRQDISGAAIDDNGIIVLFDDGGKPSDFSAVRILSADLPDATVDVDGIIVGDDPALNVPLALEHDDMEGASFIDGYFVVTSSLSASGGASVDKRNRLTRFQISGDALVNEETRSDLRDDLINAIIADIGGRFDGTYNFEAGGTSGGLNIEGLTVKGHDSQAGDTILWGIRAPLAFADLADPSNQKLGSGAIIAQVDDPWGAATVTVLEVLDLGPGQGIRGIEWIPELNAYAVIAGTLIKASDYHLWLWSPDDGSLTEITDDVQNFAGLCRPESVIQFNPRGNQQHLAILSEESGTACETVDFNYITKKIIPNQ